VSQEPVQIAQELARIARENDLAEIEYRGNDLRLRLTFEYPERAVQVQPAYVSEGGSQAPAASAASSAPAGEAAPPVSHNPQITSPLAGVFYRSGRPGAAPFVEAGQNVQTGDTLCIVEAMKLMNEISAETPMRIVKILVENGAVVESGQGLFEYESLG
jgi:acetyl-CoA carboxylase biotin carboxyl carrier protein